MRKILGEHCIVKDVGELSSEGSQLDFLGRILMRLGDEIHMTSSKGYIQGLLEILGLTRAKGVRDYGNEHIKTIAGRRQCTLTRRSLTIPNVHWETTVPSTD